MLQIFNASSFPLIFSSYDVLSVTEIRVLYLHVFSLILSVLSYKKVHSYVTTTLKLSLVSDVKYQFKGFQGSKVVVAFEVLVFVLRFEWFQELHLTES